MIRNKYLKSLNLILNSTKNFFILFYNFFFEIFNNCEILIFYCNFFHKYFNFNSFRFFKNVNYTNYTKTKKPKKKLKKIHNIKFFCYYFYKNFYLLDYFYIFFTKKEISKNLKKQINCLKIIALIENNYLDLKVGIFKVIEYIFFWMFFAQF